MCANGHEQGLGDRCIGGITRRGFLGGLGGAAALGAVAVRAASQAPAAASSDTGSGLPVGSPLRVKPALLYAVPQRVEK